MTDAVSTDVPPAVRAYRWTRRTYERMGAAGVFPPGARVQLIEGEVIEMSPQRSGHATAVSLVEHALRAVWPEGAYLRVQLPLAVSRESEPEPDVAVVRGVPRDYAEAHPAFALLVVEVSDGTLTFDRTRKRAVYARAGIPEYWIVNLEAGELEVHRDPHGDTYAATRSLAPEARLSPLHAPAASIAVEDLLP